MKYKIVKGTKLFNQLTALNERIKLVDKMAKDLATSLGGTEVATKGNNLAGGIDGIAFKDHPGKDGWMKVGNTWQNLYYPKAVNRQIRKQIAELPTIEYKELNDMVGFQGNQVVSESKGLAWVKSVGVFFHKEVILMETVEGSKYRPVPGVKEILGSEYDKLMKKIKPKK